MHGPEVLLAGGRRTTAESAAAPPETRPAAIDLNLDQPRSASKVTAGVKQGTSISRAPGEHPPASASAGGSTSGTSGCEVGSGPPASLTGRREHPGRQEVRERAP